MRRDEIISRANLSNLSMNCSRQVLREGWSRNVQRVRDMKMI